MEPLGATSMSWIMPSKSRPTVSGSKYLRRARGAGIRQQGHRAAAHAAPRAKHQQQEARLC